MTTDERPPIPDEKLTRAFFEELQGKPLSVDLHSVPGEPPIAHYEVSICEVEERDFGDTHSLSVIFTGSNELRLPQAMFRLTSDTLEGDLHLFLVPIGPNPKTREEQYETVFTRFRE